jgi:fatty-acyl-CoA synthase
MWRTGLRPGDRIGIWAPNCAEWTVTQYAAAKLGLILVNLNPAYRTAEIKYALTKVGCKALVFARSFKDSHYLDMLRSLAPEIGRSVSGALHAAALPELRLLICTAPEREEGITRFQDIRDDGRVALNDGFNEWPDKLDPLDPINIQFTSGTTGLPKGATLSHHNLINNGFFVGEATGIRPGSRVCIPVPLYHCFGMVMGNLGCLTHSAAMVYPGESFDPEATLAAIAAERCDVLYGVPTMFIAQLNLPGFAQYDVSSLRRGIMAGAPCPVEVMKEVLSRMHMSDITIAYGMTETSPVSFQSSRDDPIELRVSTVGQIQPHLEVKIVGQDGQTLPHGESGELCTRGYSVMLGYWNEEAKTREAIDADGWMHTGDLARMDEDGYVVIEGRIKDMVIRGGENIYPREIEEFLYTHPAIQDVQVIGVPDQTYGEELMACIILKPGAAPLDAGKLSDFCRGKLAHYKIPRYVDVRESFPMTVSGKIRKVEMREEAVARLGL